MSTSVSEDITTSNFGQFLWHEEHEGHLAMPTEPSPSVSDRPVYASFQCHVSSASALCQ